MPLSEKNKNIRKAYFDGFENPEEFKTLSTWFDSVEGEVIPDPLQQERSRAKIRKRLLKSIKNESPKSTVTYLRPLLRVAMVIGVVGIAAWGFHYYTNNSYKELDADAIAQIMPVQDSIRLTFEDGKVVLLSPDSGTNRTIGGSQAIIDGELIYNASSDAVVNNIVTTPRGNIFRINLPDGTRVWMNAKSELSFPSRFVGPERNVRLQGEAYFEVAEDDKQPFVVAFADQKVRVLGTHFNIAAYGDRTQRTTLMEGSVQLERGAEKISLLPNEQVIVVGDRLQKKTVDASEYSAWKDGYFVFHNATPNQIMEELSLWYDLKIKSDVGGSKERFSGKISQRMNLAEILEVLQVAGIHFKIGENKLKYKEIEFQK